MTNFEFAIAGILAAFVLCVLYFAVSFRKLGQELIDKIDAVKAPAGAQPLAAAPDASAVPAPVQMAGPAPKAMKEITLVGVPERTAAMLMAIVADELKVSIDQLTFISIKDVTEESA